jgi:hypothetical protein
MELSGYGPVQGTILALAWRDWGKLRETLVRVAGLHPKIWNWDLPDMKQVF